MEQRGGNVKALMDAQFRVPGSKSQRRQRENRRESRGSKDIRRRGTNREAMKVLALLGLLAGAPQPPPLVDAATVVPGLRVDLRYATSRNLLGRAVSNETRCFLLPQTASALRQAELTVAREGFTLVAWDCYRPRWLQRLLWKRAPVAGQVANPARGSNHNRGAAVDLTLGRADGTPVEMPTDFDDLTPRAARDAVQGVSAVARAHRALLRQAMLSAGFTSIRREWWHFDLAGALSLPVLEDQGREGK